MAGASTAYELSGHRHVILLEREASPGYRTSARSAALYIATYGDETIRHLTKASQAFFGTPPAEFTECFLLSTRGAMYVVRHDQLMTLAQAYAEVRGVTLSVCKLTSAEALAIMAVRTPDRVAAALYNAEAKDIDVHAPHQGYLRELGDSIRCRRARRRAAALRKSGGYGAAPLLAAAPAVAGRRTWEAGDRRYF